MVLSVPVRAWNQPGMVVLLIHVADPLAGSASKILAVRGGQGCEADLAHADCVSNPQSITVTMLMRDNIVSSGIVRLPACVRRLIWRAGREQALSTPGRQ